jgi:predicted metal-binding membrane protein
MTDIQILALATPILIVVIAYAYTTYLLSRKPVAARSVANGNAPNVQAQDSRAADATSRRSAQSDITSAQADDADVGRTGPRARRTTKAKSPAER